MPTTRCITSVSTVVFDKVGIAAVVEACGEAAGQAEHLVGGAEQQRAGIRGDAPAVEAATTARPSTGAKSNSVGLQLCRHRGRPLLSDKSLLQKNFRRIESPDAPHSV